MNPVFPDNGPSSSVNVFTPSTFPSTTPLFPSNPNDSSFLPLPPISDMSQQQQQQSYLTASSPSDVQFFSSSAPMGGAPMDFYPSDPLQQQSQQLLHQHQQQQYSSKINNNAQSMSSSFDEELPLLEELEIYPNEIIQKALTVLIPTKPIVSQQLTDSDLTGPLLFSFLLGLCLLLQGKVHFGYVFGFGILGCMLMCVVLNLMCDEGVEITAHKTFSILGYSLLPVVLLAALHIFFPLSQGIPFLLSSALTVAWCTVTSTRFIEKSLEMTEQYYLIAYPVTLFYFCFVLLTVF